MSPAESNASSAAVPAPAALVSAASNLRNPRLLWRIGIALTLLIFSSLWVRSWSRINYQFFPVGDGGVEFCLAGSSFAASILGSGLQSIQFESAGPIDSMHLIPYQARWPDGDPLGSASNPCVFAPEAETVTEIDFDRIGSFGAMLGNLRPPAGPGILFHLRLPLWLPLIALAAWWIWIERFARRRGADT